MPRFFVENFDSSAPAITGADAAHMMKSLRMKTGETVVVCDTAGCDYHCVIAGTADGRVELIVSEIRKSESEPDVFVTLFQCVPKGDKLETVIQKAVELGASEVVPVLSARCVSRPDEKSMRKKTERYLKIAENAAGQSGRGILPRVHSMIRFEEMLLCFADYDRVLFFYECGGEPLVRSVTPTDKRIAVVVGPEGGFDIAEAEAARNCGAVLSTLGKRILRTETAPLAALSCIMMMTGNLE